MTKDKALKLALEALEDPSILNGVNNAKFLIKQALAQPEQEPVGYLCENAVGHKYFRWKKPSSTYKPIALYTAPPKREWVGLTDEEMHACWDSPLTPLGMKYVRMIEAKLKEKNA